MRRVAILSIPATISDDRSALDSSDSVPGRDGATAEASKHNSMKILMHFKVFDVRLERGLFMAGVV
jgi:hypothetical protein